MKLSCTKENLLQALNLTSGVAGKNINLPILNNVLFKVDTQKAKIAATNLDLAITVSLRAKIEQPGNFTVPAKTLLDFVNLLSGDRIDLELEGNELLVRCGKSTTKIKGTGAEDFPIIPQIEQGKEFVLNNKEFKHGLGAVLVAVAKNDIRPELSGVYCGFNTNSKNSLVMAATDSYRLAEKKLPLLTGTEELKIIIPGRTAQEIVRLLTSNQEESDNQVKILITDNQMVVHYQQVEMVSRLVDGQYPDYVQIIPREFKSTVAVSTNEFAKEIKAAGLFTTMGVNAVTIKVNASAGSLNFSSASTQTGEYSSEISAEIKGEDNSILLSHRYLLDGLNNISSDSVLFKVINADSPCILASEGDPSYLYIVMPIRQ
jgi:DNA polymerase-3 subunit beta